MITIHFSYNPEFFLLSLRVSGHAGQAEEGHDLVCASASILAYTLASMVKQYEARMTEKPIIKLESGDSEITCRPEPKHFSRILRYYETAKEGYRLLAANYPEYVSYTDVMG